MEFSLFKYKDVVVPNDCELKISPSQISKFFDYPNVWYKENILKEEPEFKGNENTLLGTACHIVLDGYIKEKNNIEFDVYNELINMENNGINIDKNPYIVRQLFQIMSNTVINDYFKIQGKPNYSEIELSYKFDDNVYIAGHCDAYNEKTKTVIDYKTASKKPNEFEIPFSYKIQLLTYAYLLKKCYNFDVNSMEIVYMVRPLKTVPARCICVKQHITQEDTDLFNDVINLINDTYQLIKKHPEYSYIIFKDYKLKGNQYE